MTLKELRKSAGLSQIKCAEFLEIPVRTYKRYEANDPNINPIKYKYIVQCLREYGLVDEEHGKLTVDQIKEICGNILPLYPVEYCYLFGDYSKGTDTERSEVDLIISLRADDKSLNDDLAVRLKDGLKKNVRLFDAEFLDRDPALIRELLKDGVKVYDSVRDGQKTETALIQQEQPARFVQRKNN